MRRIGYHGLRRNACLALAATGAQDQRELLERLTDDPNPKVAEAASWALGRLAKLAPGPSAGRLQGVG
jgi:epoxyqueuosine reductase QueG